MLISSAWTIFLVVVAGLLMLETLFRVIRKLHPFPAPTVILNLLDSQLRRWLYGRPERVLDRVGIAPDMNVLDLGTGFGFFTVEATRRLGAQGMLYCVDLNPAAIARLEEKIRLQNLANVRAQVADACALPFPDETLDLAFLVAVLGEIPHRERALRELYRVLKHGGKLSITELLLDPDYVLKGTLLRWCRAVGFEPAEYKGNFFYYTLNFHKPLVDGKMGKLK